MEYNKNLKIIEEVRPDLYKKIVNLDFGSLTKKTDSIETATARDGSIITMVTIDGKVYRLNSAFRPMEEAKKWVQQYSFNNMNNNITMYGLGNGYFVQELLDKMLPTDYLLIFEPCTELFMHTIHNYNLETILNDSRVILGVEGINEFDFHRALHTVYGMENLANTRIVIHPSYDKIFVESVEYFKNEICESVASTKVRYSTFLKLIKSNLKNTFANIPKLQESITINQLEEIWDTDIPAIVVAAGPSLSDSLEELRWAKGKSIIVAVDRIVQYLLNKGIIPDFVVTIDPQKPLKYFSSGESIDIPMFCLLQSQPLIMEKHTGKKIICSSGLYMHQHYLNALNSFPDVELSGSVATFAVQVLKELGTKKICLVGQDLAFHGEVTHVGDVISNPGGTTGKMVEGMNGEKVQSRYDWIEFLIWLQDFIVNNPDITLIDTKEEGALIKGSTHMRLKEAIEDKIVSLDNMIDSMNTLSPAFSAEQFSKILNQMKEEKASLEKMMKKAKEGIGYCIDLMNKVKQGKTGSSSLDGKAAKVKQITKYLSEIDFYQNLDALVMATMERNYVKVFSTKEDESENMLNVFDSSRSFFEGLFESVKFVEPIMEECIKRLEEQSMVQ